MCINGCLIENKVGHASYLQQETKDGRTIIFYSK